MRGEKNWHLNQNHNAKLSSQFEWIQWKVQVFSCSRNSLMWAKLIQSLSNPGDSQQSDATLEVQTAGMITEIRFFWFTRKPPRLFIPDDLVFRAIGSSICLSSWPLINNQSTLTCQSLMLWNCTINEVKDLIVDSEETTSQLKTLICN